MTRSKADQYVEDWKNFTERKEPMTLGFGAGKTHAHVCAYGDISVHNCGSIQKEHALAFAEWIIDTYYAFAKPETKSNWRIPVVGRKYKTEGGEMAIVIRILTDAVLVKIGDDKNYISYDNFPSYYLKGDSSFNVVGFWEDDK